MGNINKIKNINESLVIKVISFSYKKGMPVDPSGNGGGFVFDCRYIHNPGRYDEYKSLTGLDHPVINFLERQEEMSAFLLHVEMMVDNAVEVYLKRGFTSLQVCFGCTGGQHRSVYAAEQVARHLVKSFVARVEITHRELNINKTLVPLTAMIFAAGMGTRLKPITDTLPKALVPIQGKRILGTLIDKLKGAGFYNFVINVHHFPELIQKYLTENDDFKTNISLSDESAELLDTGGGLQHAIPLLPPDAPILLHNVDILSNCSIGDLMTAHLSQRDCHATLLVSPRETQRYLLFNKEGRLCGWVHKGTGETKPEGFVYTEGKYREYAFSGIQVVSPSLLKLLPQGKYSIIDFYLQHCSELKIMAYVVEKLRLLDIGKLDTLEMAEHWSEEEPEEEEVPQEEVIAEEGTSEEKVNSEEEV